jgi:hypothetical protein
MSNNIPKTVKRQIGPNVWTFSGVNLTDGGVDTTWLLTADTPGGGSTLVTHIAGDMLNAYDPAVGQGSKHPLPYPDWPYRLADVEQEAWHVVKYLPNPENNQVELYQLVGLYSCKPE